MNTVILQISVVLLTAFISINSLRKDLRSTKKKLRDETINNILAICVVIFISICISILTYSESESDKKTLNRNLDSIKNANKLIGKKNDTLRNVLNKNSVATSNLITLSQQESAKDLIEAAKSLRDLINGGNSVPIFSFTLNSNKKVTGVLTNNSSKTVYNVTCQVDNFDNIRECGLIYFKPTKSFVIKTSCLIANRISLGLFTALGANEGHITNLPNFKIASEGRYLIYINFKSKSYREEAIYRYVSNNVDINLEQAIRVLEISHDGKRILREWTAKNSKYRPKYKNVNWKKEFPDSYVLNVGTVDF